MRQEIFFFKNHQENKTRRLVPGLFLFFKKALYEIKASGLQLSFNRFWQSSTWIQRYSQFRFFRKSAGNSFSNTISDAIFCYYMTKFHCLIAFTSWDVGQYVYCNCFVNQVMTSSILKLTLSFWTIRFSIWPKSQDKHLNILRMKRAFKVK